MQAMLKVVANVKATAKANNTIRLLFAFTLPDTGIIFVNPVVITSTSS